MGQPSPQVLDEELVAELLAVERASNSEIFAPFLMRVATGSTLSVASLHHAIDCCDVDRIAAHIHQIKGIAASFGLARVAHLAAAAYASAAVGILPTRDTIDVLAAAIATDVAELRNYIFDAKPSPTT